MDDLSYIINHLGEDRERHHGAVVPPTYQASIFASPTVAEFRQRIADEYNAPFYTRGTNPTVATLAAKIAALEGAQRCLCFASGSGAIAAGVLALVRGGDEIVSIAHPYTWTRRLFSTFLGRFSVSTRYVDPGDGISGFARAIGSRTRLVFIETPNSMTFEQVDIAQICKIAHAAGAQVMVDNSYATPLKQRPLQMGADLVAHSATKYLAGHSDVVAGALCGSDDLLARVFSGPYMTLGAILSPADAALVVRGLRTLPLRLERCSKTAAVLVDFLKGHALVERVYYPDSLGTGLFSVELRVAEVDDVERFCNALRRFLMTCSWGGYESLAFPVCGALPKEAWDHRSRPSWKLVRFSAGLEPADLLVEDLERGFAALS